MNRSNEALDYIDCISNDEEPFGNSNLILNENKNDTPQIDATPSEIANSSKLECTDMDCTEYRLKQGIIIEGNYFCGILIFLYKQIK